MQHNEQVILSPASAGARIKGFHNVGGWGTEGLRFIVENGVCPVEKWPANAIQRSYLTADNIALAKKYRITEWYDLRPRNYKQLISCVLRNWPVAVGYNWWSHEVTAYDAVIVDGKVLLRIRNSWSMNWGDAGFSVLSVAKGTPDDAVVPRVALPTGNYGALASILGSYQTAV